MSPNRRISKILANAYQRVLRRQRALEAIASSETSLLGKLHELLWAPIRQAMARRRERDEERHAPSALLASVQRLPIEMLEPRLLFSADPLANVFARFEGSVDQVDQSAQIEVSIREQDFTLDRGVSILSFRASGADGSSLDPARMTIRDSDGEIVNPRYNRPDLRGSTDALLLADLGTGDYTVEVSGESGSTGDFTLDVALVGDLDGDGDVERDDRDAARALLLNRQYQPEADANQDGRVSSFDYTLARRNLRDATSLQLLTLDAGYDPQPSDTAIDGTPLVRNGLVTLTGSTAPGSTVQIDVDGNGANDASALADADTGEFSIDITLANGLNQVQLRVQDGFGQLRSVSLPITFETAPRITSISPANGAEFVNVTRETIVRFDAPVDPATVSSDAFYLIANGERVAGRIVVSSTQRFATFFYDDALPASTEVRVMVDGNLIRGINGLLLDADNDGTPGGQTTADFRTLPLTRIPGTNVFGFVRDSVTGHALVGATIRVDAFPVANAVTDENGRFELTDMPAPEFFVHVDGSTATHLNIDGVLTALPEGVTYPSVGKPFHSVPGQSVQLEMDGETFDVFLPVVNPDAIVQLSETEDTVVGFGETDLQRLQDMFPEVDPEGWERLEVTIPAGSAQDDRGNAATEAFIIPVDPDRLPAPLSPGMNPDLVFSVQAPGANNFDVPASVSFPNTNGLAPGEQALLFSFDHDAGEWAVNGTATVSEDGLTINTDPGVGIVAPGWHFLEFFNIFKPCKEGSLECEDKVMFTAGLSVNSTFTPLAIEVSAFTIQFPGMDPILDISTERIMIPPGGFQIVDEPSTVSIQVSESVASVFRQLTFSPTVLGAEARITATVGQRIQVGVSIMPGDTFVTVSNDLIPIDASIGVEGRLSGGFCSIPFAGSFLCQPLNFELSVDSLFRLADLIPDLPQFPVPADAMDGPLNGILTLEIGVADFEFLDSEIDIGAFFIEGGASAPEDQDRPMSGRGNTDGLRNGVDPILFANESSLLSDSIIPGHNFDYYRIELPETGSSFFGQVREDGDIEEWLPPNTNYELYMYRPSTGESGVYFGRSGVSGDSTSPYIEFLQGSRVDSDRDGLSDVAEFTIGTNISLPDSDSDSISDFDEISQGLDPLDGRAFPTGIISSLPLFGEANEVVLSGSTVSDTQLAYVATGSHGLAIVDASQFNNPIVLGQLDLTGRAVDVAVDDAVGIAIIAAENGGLHFVDVSDPMLPTLIRSENIFASHVEIIGGIAFVGVGSEIQSYEIRSGTSIASLDLGASAITGMAQQAGLLYTMHTDRTLRITQTDGLALTARGSVQLPTGAGQLFVNGNVAYVAAGNDQRGGYATIDISNPEAPALISGSDVEAPFIAPGDAIVTNGSNHGLLMGRGIVDLVDVSDPDNTNARVTRFNMPSNPIAAAIGSGIAFVAAGNTGLHVINYLPFDNQGQAPEVTITATPTDAAAADGIQVSEGDAIPVQVTISDDVQVRNVELLVNGEVVANDISAPFDFTAIAPRLSESNEVTIQVRAFDTGGNGSLSNAVVYDVVPDNMAPVLLGSNLGADEVGFDLNAVLLIFDEAIDPGQVGPDSVQIFNLDDQSEVSVTNVSVVGERQIAIGWGELMQTGRYQITIDSGSVADRAGNTILDDVTYDFTNIARIVGVNQWITADGDWANASNWSLGRVPDSNDDAVIEIPGQDVTITLSGASQVVHGLSSTEHMLITAGGSLDVQGNATIAAELLVEGGSHLGVTGKNTSLVVNGEFQLSNGTVSAGSGATIVFNGPSSLAGDLAADGEGARIEFNIASVGDLRAEASGGGRILVLNSEGSRSTLNLNVPTVDRQITTSEVTLVSDGFGSLIDLSAVSGIDAVLGSNSLASGGRGFSTILATNGGRIGLSSVENITVIDSTPFAGGSPPFGFSGLIFTAETGGVIDLSSLGTMSTSHTPENLRFMAESGGAIDLEQLQTLGRSSLTINSGGSYVFDQLTGFDRASITINTDTDLLAGLTQAHNGQLNINNAVADLSGLLDISNTTVALNGGSMNLDHVIQADGASLLVSAGSTLSLPAVTTYAGSIDDVWRSTGVGSTLRLPSLVSLINGDGLNWDMNIQAQAGGLIDLAALASVVDPSTGDIRDRAVHISADGFGSIVDMSSLTRFIDVGSEHSTLSATNLGQIVSPLLEQLESVDVSLASGGLISTGQIVRLHNGAINLNSETADFSSLVDLSESAVTLSGGSIDLSAVDRADGASLAVSGGATLALPSLATYSGSIDDVWRSDGTGSVLSLPNLRSITNGDGRDWDLFIQAETGGIIDLSSVVSIVDPTTGDVRDRAVHILADGFGSTIDLSSLVSIVDAGSEQTTLVARNSGQLITPVLSQLENVGITLESNGQMETQQIARLFNSAVTVNNIIADFSGLSDLTGSAVALNAGSISLDNVALANGASFFVNGGAVLSLPSLTTYSGSIDDTWRAAGKGSVLDLSNLVSVTNGDGRDWDLFIEAQTGGLVDLSLVTSIVDPSTGDTRDRAIHITADGTGSVVDLSALVSFVDAGGELSTLVARNQGRVLTLLKGTSFQRILITVEVDSEIDGSLILLDGTNFTNNGTVTGTVTDLRTR